ncbi:U5 putative protein [Boteke virus]|uniref:Uncharacterized protein n=1 Tax=Boteke virus TaxID=864698 RepID=A0AAE9BMF7_9RHAB|nr:U5 putative protein [Boteke virus]UAU42848.1 U5 putative protein [Boteke virus]
MAFIRKYWFVSINPIPESVVNVIELEPEDRITNFFKNFLIWKGVRVLPAITFVFKESVPDSFPPATEVFLKYKNTLLSISICIY